MSKDQVAFVANTMPFSQIVKLYELLGISLVVCASTSLQNSYIKGFERLGLDIDVRVISGNRLSKILSLLAYLYKSNKAVIFHECCWPDLDLLIILFRVKTIYLPSVTLASRKKVSVRDIPLKQRISATLTSRWFDFYETRDDGGKAYFVPALKQCYRKVDSPPSNSNIERYCDAERKVAIGQRLRVLILSGTDVAPNNVLKELYSNISTRLLSSGVEVHIKDHPNPIARLNWKLDGVQLVDSELPLECLKLSDYSAFVSVASTGLAACAENGKIISVIRLLPAEFNEQLEKRLSHLSALNVKPLLPLSVDELVNQVTMIR